ncbi:MAG: hypothetical protein QNJ12_11495 [Ilumatobacter sp.]|uniref:hypothetical protein n=1 Tax=Ilumatobacter sp. TaxID=1967498 RepID=UPI00260B94D4|nr:hypothetical protein [Ilumatobacter sp.]MDJ0769414.1 hypothetical protein [Ilumatobacter sp.]
MTDQHHEVVVPDEVFDPPSAPPPTRSSLPGRGVISHGVQRRINQIHGKTVVRIADAGGEAVVAQAKIKESSSVIDAGMSSLALLAQKAALYAGGDPILFDKLMSFYIDVAQMGHTTIIADLFDKYGKR